MAFEDIVQRWQPAPDSQLQQWIDQLATLGVRSDQLLARRGQLIAAQHEAAGRRMLAHFRADPVAMVQAAANCSVVDAELEELDGALVRLREQETTLEIQIYQADEYLQGIMARLEQALTTAVSGQLSDQVSAQVSNRIDTEFISHERRVRRLLGTETPTND